VTQEDIFDRIYNLSASDADGLGKLAQEVGFHCREPAKTVLAELIGGPPERKTPCAFICTQLKELAVGEALRHTDSAPPPLRVQLMEMVVTQQLTFRELMLTALEPLLEDVSSGDSDEELRTCDVAYLIVRKLVRVGATEVKNFSGEEQFKALAPNQRDIEIEKWLISATWKEIFPEPYGFQPKV
jgi:hypothetical protein